MVKRNNLKILFRTAGGRAKNKQLGLGHIYRSINLALNLKPNEIYFLIEDYGGVKRILEENGFKKNFFLKKDISIESDIKKTIQYIFQKKIDILIIDKYDIKIKYLKKLKGHTKIVLVTDLWKVNYPANLLVNGFIGFNNKLIKNKYGSRCLLGPAYQILNNKFIKRKSTRKKKYNLLATFGGFDEKHIVDVLLESLTQYFKKIRTKIILGPVTTRSKRVTLASKQYGKYIKIINATKNMHEEISNAEFGICSGGITSYEFAAMKIPFAIICDVPHQLKTAKEWQKRGVAINLGLINKKTRKKINHLLEDLANNVLPLEKKHNIRIDGLGSKRVASEILKI